MRGADFLRRIHGLALSEQVKMALASLDLSALWPEGNGLMTFEEELLEVRSEPRPGLFPAADLRCSVLLLRFPVVGLGWCLRLLQALMGISDDQLKQLGGMKSGLIARLQARASAFESGTLDTPIMQTFRI